MAGNNLQAPTSQSNDDRPSDAIRDRYVAFKRTKAEWDAWNYATGGDRLDADDDSYCAANTKALNELLLTPSENLRDLEIKLRVFNDEEIDDGWTMARPIVALLADDAKRLVCDA